MENELERVLSVMCDHYCKHAASDVSMETLHDICSECPLKKLITKECRKVLKEL